MLVCECFVFVSECGECLSFCRLVLSRLCVSLPLCCYLDAVGRLACLWDPVGYSDGDTGPW